MAPVGQLLILHLGEGALLEQFIGHLCGGHRKHEILAAVDNIDRQILGLVQIKHADDHAGRGNRRSAGKQLGTAQPERIAERAAVGQAGGKQPANVDTVLVEQSLDHRQNRADINPRPL